MQTPVSLMCMIHSPTDNTNSGHRRCHSVICVCEGTDLWRSLIHFDTPDLVHNVLGPVVDCLVDPLSCPTLCVHYKPTHTCWRLPAQRKRKLQN